MMVTEASEALATIGMNLIVTDLTNSSELWTGLEANQVAIWAAAWGATVDPDMYQIYYSDVANGGAAAGGSNYMYGIADEELDQLILDARKSLDQSYRKTMYKACLDIIIDWACEIPCIPAPERNYILRRSCRSRHCNAGHHDLLRLDARDRKYCT